jgi:hypothetical protein
MFNRIFFAKLVRNKKLKENRKSNTRNTNATTTSSSVSDMYPRSGQFSKKNQYYKKDGKGGKFPRHEPSRYYAQSRALRDEHERRKRNQHERNTPIKNEDRVDLDAAIGEKKPAPDQTRELAIWTAMREIRQRERQERGETYLSLTPVERNRNAEPARVSGYVLYCGALFCSLTNLPYDVSQLVV